MWNIGLVTAGQHRKICMNICTYINSKYRVKYMSS